jgi:hypothetical protein
MRGFKALPLLPGPEFFHETEFFLSPGVTYVSGFSLAFSARRFAAAISSW